MRKLLLLLLLSCYFPVMAQIPKVSSGKIERIENFKSQYIEPRNVDVWLPDDYHPSKKYAVLYMHDGQMLFDSTMTWNHQEWGVDEIVSKLLAEHKIEDCIVVGIWNTGAHRHTDYFPEKPIAYLPKSRQDSLIKQELAGEPKSDEYLLFLTKELKPFIDQHFSTYTDQAHTFIIGSSMGGLISMYAICEYPTIFGGAACMSTHWPGSLKKMDGVIPAAFNKYLDLHLPSPKNHKIYFDYGSETLDSYYKPYQLKVDETMKAHGYTAENWETKEFPGQNHSEKSWRSRLDIPLIFLLGK